MKWFRERLRSIQSRVPTACADDPYVEFSERGDIRIVDPVSGDSFAFRGIHRHVKLIGGQLLDVAREVERRGDEKYEVRDGE